MKYTRLSPRESDQRVFVADISKIQQLTGWKPEVRKVEGIKKNDRLGIIKVLNVMTV